MVNDFRIADVKAGGQGAPLVPVYHMALAAHLEGSLAILNIGGVANVTWIGEGEEMLAFDVGAGNAMINDVAKREFALDFDEGGKLARKGIADGRALAEYMSHEFFAKVPPKSLDRNEFDLGLVSELEPHDQLATLTQFAVEGVMAAQRRFPAPVDAIYVTGGGRHNEFMMDSLRGQIAGAEVLNIDDLGLDGDALEAQAFAYLAARVLYELPITFPNTTGCKFSPVGNAAAIHKAP